MAIDAGGTGNTPSGPNGNGNGKNSFGQKLAPTKLKLQTFVLLAFLIVDGAMFWQLASGLDAGEISAPVAGLLGGLIGAVTTSLGLAAKDYFNPED